MRQEPSQQDNCHLFKNDIFFYSPLNLERMKRPDWYSKPCKAAISEGCAYLVFALEKNYVFICIVEILSPSKIKLCIQFEMPLTSNYSLIGKMMFWVVNSITIGIDETFILTERQN